MTKLTLRQLDCALDQAMVSRDNYIAKLKEEPYNFSYYAHQLYLVDCAISVLLEEIDFASKAELWPAA